MSPMAWARRAPVLQFFRDAFVTPSSRFAQCGRRNRRPQGEAVAEKTEKSFFSSRVIRQKSMKGGNKQNDDFLTVQRLSSLWGRHPLARQQMSSERSLLQDKCG